MKPIKQRSHPPSPFRRGSHALYADLARRSVESRIKRNIEAEIVLDPERVTRVPARRRETDAGYDISACELRLIPPGRRVVVATGLRIKCPPGYFYQIQDRSSLLDADLAVEDHIIDATYTGEIFIHVKNLGRRVYTVHPGERIAQLIFLPQIHVKFVRRAAFAALLGERGDAGNGSSGRE